MVTLHQGANWKVTVYGRDHGIPHFHIEGRGFRCSVAIEIGVVIVGHVPNRVYLAAWMWAQANKPALHAKWKELNR